MTNVVIYVMLRMKNTGKENKNRFPCFLQKNRGGHIMLVLKRKNYFLGMLFRKKIAEKITIQQEEI
ncbi:hypothetical protein A2U06_06465 [Fusobacterium necrophorum subsp. funduliforme]|nr:hypothetical protein A2U06_06465 [Fusobacterium necrophorum subsp. funduliforme]KYM53530.1 hypothetical protein A2U17_06320 [Fusobacterium necrophorum subsp. funduliforme]